MASQACISEGLTRYTPLDLKNLPEGLKLPVAKSQSQIDSNINFYYESFEIDDDALEGTVSNRRGGRCVRVASSESCI